MPYSRSNFEDESARRISFRALLVCSTAAVFARSQCIELARAGRGRRIADPEQWLFLDTETTGLAGGSGTYAFLVGIAWWEDGGLEIEQFFLREQSEERALLFALRERIAERPILVSFNGKSFDWPLLETRYRM